MNTAPAYTERTDDVVFQTPPSAKTASVRTSGGKEDRVATQRALLNDPIRFAEEMTERVFYLVFPDLFTYDRASVRHFTDLITVVRNAAGGPAQAQAIHDLDDASHDVIGDVLSDTGIPMGVAIERVRCVLLDCLERMNNPRVPYPNRDRYLA